MSGRVQDPTGRWRTRVGKLADLLGWRRPRLYQHWSHIAMAVEIESLIEHGIVIERHMAELAAFHILEAAVTKQEGEPS